MLVGTKGINLVNCGKDIYKFGDVIGTMIEIATVMYAEGMDVEEISIGFEQMDNNKHQVAHYGMGGTFIFSRELRKEDAQTVLEQF